MEEKKQLTLEDLGAAKVITPADKIEMDNNPTSVETITEESKPVVETVQATTNTGESVELDKVETKKPFIPRPTSADGKTTYGNVIKNVDSIAKVKSTKPVDPIRNTLDGLYKMTDKAIERNKKEMLAPDGRINEAKYKYIMEKYDLLMNRAKNNERLARHIQAIENVIATDPVFEGITDYEHKGYILFTVAHDEKVGFDNAYFGIKEEERRLMPRNSNDANKAIESYTKADDGIDPLDSDDMLTLGKFDDFDIEEPKVMEENKTTEEIKETPVVSNNTTEVEKPQVTETQPEQPKEEVKPLSPDDAEDDEYIDDIDDYDFDGVDIDDDEAKKKEREEVNSSLVTIDNLTPDEQKEVSKLFKEFQAKETEGIDLSKFTVSNKTINIGRVIRGNYNKPKAKAYAWPLVFSGRTVTMTPISGEELPAISPENNEFESIPSLRKYYKVIYNHDITSGKKPFEEWLNDITVFDRDSIIFGLYASTFKDTNYITYRCTNSKCKKIFMEKKDMNQMFNLTTDELKKRFNDILQKDRVGALVPPSDPVLINRDYAVTFRVPSVYNYEFQTVALGEDFTKKHARLVQLSQYIDKIYHVDLDTHELNPITYGKIDDVNDIRKNTLKRIKSIFEILKSFNTDDNNKLYIEFLNYYNKSNEIMAKYLISFRIPETECPHCHQKIEAIESVALRPLDLLFMRALLPLTALYTNE